MRLPLWLHLPGLVVPLVLHEGQYSSDYLRALGVRTMLPMPCDTSCLVWCWLMALRCCSSLVAGASLGAEVKLCRTVALVVPAGVVGSLL